MRVRVWVGVGQAAAVQARAVGSGLVQWKCTSWCCCVQAYGDDILLHLNVANFLPSIPLQLLTVPWRDQPGADARRGGERWVWARLLLGA